MSKKNKVNKNLKNEALISLFKNPKQQLVVDANFFIPPDRSRENSKAIPFKAFKSIWLDNLIDTFNPIIIHEAVYEEFQTKDIKDMVNMHTNKKPPLVIVVKDYDLSEDEQITRNTIEAKISKHTQYEPEIDNKDDRGEVKSLSYIAVKGLLYFCSQDANSIRLIEESEKLETNLDNISAIRMYEIIYYFIKNNIGNRNELRILYKYVYYSTKSDKAVNPNWSEFEETMDKLYENLED
ncbi:MAG: hypothetical protein RR942_08895 [Romboutsia sp.]